MPLNALGKAAYTQHGVVEAHVSNASTQVDEEYQT